MNGSSIFEIEKFKAKNSDKISVILKMEQGYVEILHNGTSKGIYYNESFKSGDYRLTLSLY
jgi:phosphoserine aminotransferase